MWLRTLYVPVAVLMLSCEQPEPTPAEERICGRAEECNIIAPIGAEGCVESEMTCTEALGSSAHDDWVSQVSVCLEPMGCKTFLNCIRELSTCSPIGPTECGPACDYCWIGTAAENACPLTYESDGSCDCGCQFDDQSVDCGIGR